MSYLVCEHCKHLIATKWHTPFEGETFRDCGVKNLVYAIAGEDFNEACTKFEPKEDGDD